MDKWNRYDQNEYTGISAQRRNRRRADGEPAAPETAPRTPAFPDKPAAVKDTAFSAPPETSAAEGSLDRIRRFMRPEAPSEPESFDEPEEEFEEQTVIEEPEVFELPDEREETAGPSEPVNPEGFSWLEEPDDPELPEEPAETEASEEPGENEEPEVTAGPSEPVEPEEPEASAEPAEESAEPAEAEPAEAEPAEAAEPEEPEEPASPAGQETRREPVYVVQGADSRVPTEARRMAETPYGTAGDAVRADTRPRTSQRRPVRPEDRKAAVRPEERKAAVRPRYESSAGRPQAGPQRARVHVGYAPGRMSDDMTQQIPTGESVRESLYTRDARAYLEKRKQPFRVEDNVKQAPDRPGTRILGIVVALLVLAGAVLTGMMLQKNRGASGGQVIREAPRVISFEAQDAENRMAPTDLMFIVVTDKNADGIRLRGEDDKDLDTDAESVDDPNGKMWQMRFHVEYGFSGTVRLQVRRTGDEYWYDTDYTANLNVTSLPGMEPAAAPETTEAPQADPDDDDYYNPDEENQESGDESEGEPGAENPEENAEDEGPEEEPAWESEEGQKDVPEEEGELPAGALRTQVPTSTPAPATPEPTAVPPLTAEAAPEADPALITSTTVYTGTTKKVKEYSRPAKELIHMPEADQYSKRQLGVLTFRGDNFRRNAAVGALSSDPVGLSVLWQTEAGKANGSGQTYYGYGWTGQPVIARWSTEVRTHSNITDVQGKDKDKGKESKKNKKALKEVIIAGLDGAIRFLDLEDGKITRNSIKLGYPMRGTPSLHPRGYPFMSVGQFARKMKSKTGKIGLRQYNLFTQGETKLIDGLDGKYHRPLNNVGSFETSALIDRESDTLIAIGSNGMLYLESLGSTFDYNTGVMTISPSTTAMTSKAKGQKNTALMAVESSPAAYDKYVFYADMGGVLRCVDTNTLKPVWAVDTGDSVMAAVAMDMTGEQESRELNLYTANMLNNRKKGNSSIQIRRYNAMTGKQAWSTDIGVYKGKKDKDDVGAKASPVIGQHALDRLVYFTVTGLSEDGASKLGLRGEDKAALIALDKDTGNVVWSFGLSSRSESSPIALYDEAGNGWILQCEQKGIVHLLDGLSGDEVSSLDLKAEIEASPAAYNNVVVIGTTGKQTSFVYGIRVELDHPTQEAAEAPQAEAPAEPQDAGEQAENESDDMPEGEDLPEDDDIPEDEYDNAQEGGAEDEEVPGGA